MNSDIPITTLGELFGFNDASARTLLNDPRFRKTFWGLVSYDWKTTLIATKTDYLLVKRYEIFCYGKYLTLFVSRPLEVADSPIPEILSIRVYSNTVRVFFVDGYICSAGQAGKLLSPIDSGVYIGSIDIGTYEYGLDELSDGTYALRRVDAC